MTPEHTIEDLGAEHKRSRKAWKILRGGLLQDVDAAAKQRMDERDEAVERVALLESALLEVYEIAGRTGEFQARQKYPIICRSGRGLAMELFPIINKALGRETEVSR